MELDWGNWLDQLDARISAKEKFSLGQVKKSTSAREMWPGNNEILVLCCPVFVVGACTMKKTLQVYQQFISSSEIYGSATGKKMGTHRWREVSVQLHKKKAGLEASGRR